MGADVVIRAGDENLIRSRQPGDPGERPFVVIVEGLANLLHEFVHILLAGRLADDHGVDYQRIPFQLAYDQDRRLLWEELACCQLSCAHLPGDEADRDAWFLEQIGIQGVFFGVAGVADFIELVDGARARWPGALEQEIARGAAALETALVAHGMTPEAARPTSAVPFAVRWQHAKNVRSLSG